jgi:hypothetical protein
LNFSAPPLRPLRLCGEYLAVDAQEWMKREPDWDGFLAAPAAVLYCAFNQSKNKPKPEEQER